MHNSAFLTVQAALLSNHEALLNFQAERAAASKARDAAQVSRDAAQTAHEAFQREAAEANRRLLKFDMLVKGLAPIAAAAVGVLLGFLLRGPSTIVIQAGPASAYSQPQDAKR